MKVEVEPGYISESTQHILFFLTQCENNRRGSSAVRKATVNHAS